MANFKHQDYIFKSTETLNLLSRDEDCIVKGYKNIEIAKRLLNHGLLPGMHVTKKQKSPLGKASVYEFDGQLIVLRDDEANCVNINCVF